MAYNHRKAELQWLTWKQQEEKRLRELGMDEQAIQSLRTYDREQFNRERRYFQRWANMPDAVDIHAQEAAEPVFLTPDSLLDSIENEQLLKVLRSTDEITLKMLVLRLQGYSSKEIAQEAGVTVNAVDLRLHRLKRKIKKYFA